MLSSYEVTLLQLVDLGLCKWSDFKDGSLNFRDVIKLLEYARLKGAVQSWKMQRIEADNQARHLIR